MCTWTDRVDREFAADNFTRTERDALLALASFRGHDGELFPSQAAVAGRAQCSDRTVRRAITMAVTRGLVVVLPRRRLVKGRYVRTSNRYVIGIPDRIVAPRQRPLRPRSTGQTGHRQDSVKKEDAMNALLREAAGRPDLLAARREVIHRRQIAAASHQSR